MQHTAGQSCFCLSSVFSACLWCTVSTEAIFSSLSGSPLVSGNVRSKPQPTLCFPETLHGLEMCSQSSAELFSLTLSSAYVYLYSAPRVLWHCSRRCLGPQGRKPRSPHAGCCARSCGGNRTSLSPRLGLLISADCLVALRAGLGYNETIYKHLK